MMNIQSKVNITARKGFAKRMGEYTDPRGRIFHWDRRLERALEVPPAWLLSAGAPSALSGLAKRHCHFRKSPVPGMAIGRSGAIGVSLISQGLVEEEAVIAWVAALALGEPFSYVPNHPFFDSFAAAPVRAAFENALSRKDPLNSNETSGFWRQPVAGPVITNRRISADLAEKETNRRASKLKPNKESPRPNKEGRAEIANLSDEQKKAPADAAGAPALTELEIAGIVAAIIKVEEQPSELPRTGSVGYALIEELAQLPGYTPAHRAMVHSALGQLGYTVYARQLVKQHRLARLAQAVQTSPQLLACLSAPSGCLADSTPVLVAALARQRRKELLAQIDQVFREKGALLPAGQEWQFPYLVEQSFLSGRQLLDELAYHQIDLGQEHRRLAAKYRCVEEELEEGEIR